MLRKPYRPADDIDRLADELRSRLRFGENVEDWMRRNVAKLTRLVRDQGWRWEDIGSAMTRAGITYSTGRAWTPEVLRVKASEARAQIKARQERRHKPKPQASASPSPGLYVRAVVQPLDRIDPAADQWSEPGRPKFEPAQIVSRHETSPRVPIEPGEKLVQEPTPKHDADAMIKRFFGNIPDSE